MKYKDYYALLGVPQDANLDQIKKAYRKLARENHPDMSKAEGAEARFKEIGEAYTTLKDEEKRAAYDALGKSPEGGHFSPPPHWREQYQGQSANFDEMDLADLLASLNQRHPGEHSQSQPQRGRDFEDTVHISLNDALLGTTMGIKLLDQGVERELEVKIPAGVSEGQKIRMRGMGGKGLQGAAAGDFYLHVKLKPHPIFNVIGSDLFFSLKLAPWEAALGAEVEVPTLEGNVLLSVPAGTNTGRKLRLKSRGIRNAKGERGDQYAIAQVVVGTQHTQAELDLYKQLSKLSNFKPREKN